MVNLPGEVSQACACQELLGAWKSTHAVTVCKGQPPAVWVAKFALTCWMCVEYEQTGMSSEIRKMFLSKIPGARCVSLGDSLGYVMYHRSTTWPLYSRMKPQRAPHGDCTAAWKHSQMLRSEQGTGNRRHYHSHLKSLSADGVQVPKWMVLSTRAVQIGQSASGATRNSNTMNGVLLVGDGSSSHSDLNNKWASPTIGYTKETAVPDEIMCKWVFSHKVQPLTMQA